MSSSSWKDFVNIIGATSSCEVNFYTAIQINSCHDDDPFELSQWPCHMLKKVMSLSSNILEMPEKIRNKIIQNNSQNAEDIFEFNIENLLLEDDEAGLAHPMDVLLYLFFSCDRIFRQSFVSRVAKSQLSIPLIAIEPKSNCPTLYLFAMQTLFKDCYIKSNNFKSFSVSEEKLPIISFLRLGDCESSKKSQILNEIIGVNHSYFFNRNCKDSIRKTFFLKGTVEVAWYLPGLEQRIINEPLVFLNLRGDASLYPKQANFMAKISTLICLFIPCYFDSEEIEQVILTLKQNYENKLLFLVYKSPKYNDKRNNLKSMNDKEKIILQKPENIRLCCDNICNKLVYFLEKVNRNLISLKESQGIAKQLAIVVDNDDVILNTNNHLQDTLAYLRSSIESHKSSETTTPIALAKKQNLPLQGKPWKDLAQARRDLFLVKTDQLGGNLEEYKKEIYQRMEIASAEQLQVLQGKSSIFLRRILDLNHNEVILHRPDVFYLNWKLLQNELDLISLEYLPILHAEYKKLLRQTWTNDEDVESHQREKIKENAQQYLLKAANNIIESSFGIEHVFRELGQAYETYLYYSTNNDKLSSLKKLFTYDVNVLPEIVAKLMLAGHSFEIMDGDVNHVPQSWVKAVLHCLSKLIGKFKKIFVLTILGIQSSGKSTLLNTMFGVNFSVSSGRCTRGVFMQIIPINEELANTELGYDYLVLLDTEGFRAPELLGNYCYRHDNELATFVIGLGDLTLINIFGENHTEMQDIIQITVIAFMRMNISVHRKPKCIFVHQNVGDIQVNNNLMFSRCNLIKSLDEMTKIAAIQEKKDMLFTHFSDVIEFDPESDVFYFPNFHDGEPPMTRVSTCYFRSAKKLKNKILTVFSANRRNKFLSLSDWNSKIQIVWESILKENFAFSYRNILELHCRFELDSALCGWSSKFAHSMLTYKSDLINLLLNTESNELDRRFQLLKSDILKCTEKNVIELQIQILNHFFHENKNKNIYLNWKSSTQSYFKSLRNRERENLFADCDHVVNVQKLKFEMDAEFQKIKNVIVSKTLVLFEEIKEENSTNELQVSFDVKFDKLWASLNCSVRPIPIQQANILSDCQDAIVNSHYIQSMSIISDKFDLISKLDDYKIIGSSDFLSLYAKLSYPKSKNPYYITIDMRPGLSFVYAKIKDVHSWNTQATQSNDQFLGILQKLTADVEEFRSNIIHENINYNSNFYFLLINFIYKTIEDYNREQKKMANICIELSNDFIFDFIFYNCCMAITQFENLQQSFIKKINTQSFINLYPKLDQLKSELRKVSLDCLENVRVEHSCAEKLVQILIQPMKNYLIQFVIQKLMLNFRSDPVNVIIFKSRAALQLAVLKDLANNRKFTKYMNYISFPIQYLNDWINRKLNNFSLDQNSLNDILPTLLKKIDDLCKRYIAASQNAYKTDWKSCFHSEIISAISGLKKSDLDILDVYSISNYENLSQFFSESLNNEVDHCDWLAWLIEVFSNTKLPSHTITNSLLECKALCPFCNEPCRFSLGEHDHYCGSFHRPQGINGICYKNSYIIVTEECTSAKFKQLVWYNDKLYNFEDYRSINENFRSWNILAEDALESKYWQWVLFQFHQQFLDYYDIKYNPSIENYSYLTEQYVISDIEKQYQNYIFRDSLF